MSTQLVIDTDLGGEPDDAIALAIAARSLPELALVLTTDEKDGQRARLVRHYLNLLGRPDVAVVAGRRLSAAPYFWVDDLIPDRIPAQPSDPVAAVGALKGPVRWLGFGPMTNLAAALDQLPDLAGRLDVVQMGGALAYRDPTVAQYNFRLDPTAAASVLRRVARLQLVSYDVTFAPELAFGKDSTLYGGLAEIAEDWARCLLAQCDRYFGNYYPTTIPHTPLALSVAMGKSFTGFSQYSVNVDELGRIGLLKGEIPVTISHQVDRPAFSAWLETQLLAFQASCCR